MRKSAAMFILAGLAVNDANAQSYGFIDELLVFFEHGSAVVPARSIAIEVAACEGRGEGARIRLVARTDASGSADYNMALSQRRVQAVAAELTRRGVAPESITIAATGEAQPTVQTPDGVAEPMNRIVIIDQREIGSGGLCRELRRWPSTPPANEPAAAQSR